ncbi:hypothetical protein NBRC110019_32220 [Neptunitalea chrysea]|uniref:Cytochrome c domain-containing protein n=1 Tax=Neptunitalea chrysea TaxID=1647581 RepID=A0A9W6B787_9FLAO|nr:cytochrome c [Neptunitalea chrysea]GLB54181.1 hypothetical protein NBRC110019_32220 [Neptunitalea chrysea]
MIKVFTVVTAFVILSSVAHTTTHVRYTHQQTELEKSIARGKDIYTEFCVTCHLPNGKGIAPAFPPLDESDWLTGDRTKAIRAVKYGIKGEITVNGITYNNLMTTLGLYDDEVADVINYISNSWSNTNTQLVTEKEVQAIKE